MSALPLGWLTVNLFDICFPKQWKTISSRDLLAEGYTVYGANGEIGYYNQFTHEKSTLMITCRGATCGNLHISKPFSYINGNAMALDQLNEDFCTQRYLYRYLQLRGFSDVISGSAQPQITREGLIPVNIKLAPINEQRRITEKIDTVLARVDSVQDRLARVAPLLKRFRQSVLAAATSGRLTEDWRDRNEQNWQPTLFSKIIRDSCTGLVRSAIDQFSYNEEMTPYVKMNSIGEFWGYESNGLVGVSCSLNEIARYELKKDDWLFNTRNSLELVGKSCVWSGPEGVVFNNNILRVRFEENINPRWVEIYFRSPKGRKLLASVKSATTSVAAIYQKSLFQLEILIPNSGEQTEIVRRVETLFAFADRLEARLKTAQTAANRLTPALLAKAFRGELVPQDPNDESAAELVRRLRETRAADSASKPKSKRKQS